MRVRGGGWDHVCVQCVCSCLHTCAHVQGAGLAVVHRAQRSVQGGEASDEASVAAAITQSTLGGPETAHRRTGPWTAFLAECGHVFQIAEFKQVLVAFRGRNFGATFWSAKC